MHNMAKANLNKTESKQDQNYHSMKAYNLGEQNQHKQKFLIAWQFFKGPIFFGKITSFSVV